MRYCEVFNIFGNQHGRDVYLGVLEARNLSFLIILPVDHDEWHSSLFLRRLPPTVAPKGVVHVAPSKDVLEDNLPNLRGKAHEGD